MSCSFKSTYRNLKTKLWRAYDIKTSIHWKRSISEIQTVVKKILKLISSIIQNKFARSIQEKIYTIESKFSPTSSFLTVRTFCHSGVFLQTTTEPIKMIFHMYNTKTYTKECENWYNKLCRFSIIITWRHKIATHFTREKNIF